MSLRPQRTSCWQRENLKVTTKVDVAIMRCNALHYTRVNPMGMTSVRMPDELLDRLERTAEQLRRSKGWIIKDAVEEYLAREELKQRRNQETLESWEDYKAGRVIDGDDMMTWLESWGTDDEKDPPFK